MNETIAQLQQMDMFEGLSALQLEKIAGLGEMRDYKKDDLIFEEASPATHIFILLEGRVRIQVQLNSRPENVAIGVLGKHGQLVGWSGLVAPQSYTAAALCTADSKLLAFKGDDFFKLLEQDPVMGFKVMHKLSITISNRMRNLHQNVLKTF